ncbi:MAG: hypothetical protein M3425_02560 [Actinomycetota bacterium]|nr:hypothetical protein [Euzebyales bacterium]MDQ3342242.1 hypothetical protein [Actinomycetota bacterium]MDQ3528824.1 hypothetical protein [Actinomycetota bacterium]
MSEQAVKAGFAVIGVVVLVLATMVVRTNQTTQRLRADVERLETELAAAASAAAPADGSAPDEPESNPLQELLEGDLSAEELLRELGSAENRDALEGLLEDRGLLDGEGFEGLLDRDALEGLLDR